MSKRIAIVTPWYGDDATGGAESLALELALRLAESNAVTVVTTCSRSFLAEWDENYYRAGITSEGKLTVHRFAVDARSRTQFDALNRTLLDMPVDRWRDLRKHDEDTSAFIDESINSSELEAHLAREAMDRYDCVLFLPYLYGVVVRGIEAYPGRAHLIPCLHDEAYARLPRIEDMFHRVATILANSSGEAELALRLYGPGLLGKLHVIGSGVDFEATLRADGTLPKKVSKPFALYVGRRDVTKNVDALVEAFRRFRADRPADVSLVLAGPGTRSYDDPAAGVIDLGYVNGSQKAALIAEAVALVQPSGNESYSRVLMEAWLWRKPVAVNARCLATAMAVTEAGGGLLADTEDDWVDVFATLAEGDPSRLAAHGLAGERYARDKADWSRVLARLADAIGLASVQRANPSRGKRVDQFVQTLEYGDAISDYALAIERRLRALGFDSTIYAEGIGPLVEGRAVHYDGNSFAASDAIVYHHSIAASATAQIARATVPKAMIYHNITPAAFFRPYSQAFANLLETGRAQTVALMSDFDHYVADSNFNAAELRAMGATEILTLPVAVNFGRFDVSPDRSIFRKREDVFNVIFVGRISPSKSIRRLIEVFEAFLCFNPRAHLTIIGRYDVLDPYYRVLLDIVIERRLESVVSFVGLIHETTLLAYYQLADMYVSLSEHEGFCVPVVEAMFFDVPVVALGTTAVPETLGAGGLLVTEEADAIEIAAAMHAIVDDAELRGAIIEAQRERRRYYLPNIADRRIDAFVESLVPA